MNVVEVVRAHLDEGDLTCILCDRGAALPLAGPWSERFGAEAFAGLVRTVESPAGELAAVDRALDDLTAGSVLLISSGSGAAIWGGRLSGRASGRRAAGVVVHGRVRDVRTLGKGALPLVARGIAPHRSDASGPGTVDGPLVLAGVSVEAGDLLVSDLNGVVVVPRDRFKRIVADIGGWIEQERAKD